MDTEKVLKDTLKRMLELQSRQRLKKTDWEKVTDLSFNSNGSFYLNDEDSEKSIKWDLHNIFKFKNLRFLSIGYLRDLPFLSLLTTDVYDYKYWFNKFKELRGIYMVSGSARDQIEMYVYRYEETYLIYEENKEGFEIKIITGEDIKTLYFGKKIKLSQNYFVELLNEIDETKRVPSDFESVKNVVGSKDKLQRLNIIGKMRRMSLDCEKIYL